jgi:hypothetical protein
MDLGKPAICCQQRNIHFCAFWLYLSYLGRANPRCAALDVGAIDPMPFCTPLFNLHSTGSVSLACLGEFCPFVASDCANNTVSSFIFCRVFALPDFR